MFKLLQYKNKVDILLSHDWPTNITNYGDKESLLQTKKFLKEDIEKGTLGSPPADQLMKELKPRYHFSAHLHCKFSAIYEHKDGSNTKFLALDKCLPKRDFLQVLEVDIKSEKEKDFYYDPDWLAILKCTQKYFSIQKNPMKHPEK